MIACFLQFNLKPISIFLSFNFAIIIFDKKTKLQEDEYLEGTVLLHRLDLKQL